MSTNTSTVGHESRGNEVVVATTPSTKPTWALLGLTILIGGLLIGVVTANPKSFGNEQIADIIVKLLLLLIAIGVTRLLVRLYLLTRTRYYITTDSVRREYSLFFKTWSRELPISMVRGHELTRSRIETMFGVGTVSFLSGSVSGSIGHLRFDSLPNPEGVRNSFREQVTEGWNA